MLLSFLLAQAVSASPPERVDLTLPQPCAEQRTAADEVVVCANRDGESPYRLKEPAAPEEKPTLPKAEVQIAEGVIAGVGTEGADVGGFPSNRIMLKLKVKF